MLINEGIARREGEWRWFGLRPTEREASVESYRTDESISVYQKTKWFVPKDPSLALNLWKSIEKLQALKVKIRNHREVLTYWMRFPEMIAATVRLASVVRENFPQAFLSLEFYRDPEIYDEHLVLNIYDRQDLETMLQNIERIETSLAELLSNQGGWLLLLPHALDNSSEE